VRYMGKCGRCREVDVVPWEIIGVWCGSLA